jgi:hypothetical protein
MTTCLCCSIFKNEIEILQDEGLLSLETKYLNSMLHMNPAKLELLLGKEIANRGNQPILLIYGDCCPAMLDFSTKTNVKRTEVRNCCEMLLGQKRYRELLKDGAFFLMPEWVVRWKEVFSTQLELNRDVAVDMMRHLHKYFLYLDTGTTPIPDEILNEISDYFELPCKIEKVDIKKNFLEVLRETLAATKDD